MSVDNETRLLLAQWEGLRNGNGLARAAKLAMLLRAGAAGMLFLIAITLYQGEHPVFAVMGAFGLGWAITEGTALRRRISMWPIFARYVDWKRVQEDLGHSPAAQE